jgi:prefoldin alpha subunit
MGKDEDSNETPATGQAPTQQELQQSLMYLEYLKEQITSLSDQLEILELAVKEHDQAIDTLKDFENLDKKNEVLIPIGADSLVYAKVTENSKVILNIGSGLSKEVKIDNAIETLSSRITKIDENKTKIKDTIQNLQDQATMLSADVEAKYQQIQQ